MYSFYGGKEGRTYNIVNHYDSIHQMVENFHEGGSHTDANYNEYVIIDTLINRNKKHDRENGIIYRRGLNFNEPFDPHETLPDGKYTLSENDILDTPIMLYGYEGVTYLDTDNVEYEDGMLQLSTTEVPKYKHYEYILKRVDGTTVKEVHPRDFIIHEGSEYSEFQLDWINFVTSPGGGAIYVGQIVGPQGESPELSMVDWDTFEEEYLHSDTTDPVKGEIVMNRHPGFDLEAGYTDDIKYGWCNIRDEQDNIYGAVLAFDMPYTVFKYNAHTVSPYGPTIIEVTELPEEDINTRAYYYIAAEDNYYIWDETRTVRDSTIAAGYRYEPGFVRTDIWSISQDMDGTIYYTDMLRECAESQGHPYFKSYDMNIPRGIHGQDVLLNMYEPPIDPETDEPLPVDLDRVFDVIYTKTNYDDIMDGESGNVSTEVLCTIRAIKTTEFVSSKNGNPTSLIKITYYNPENSEEDFDEISIKTIEKLTINNQGRLIADFRDGTTLISQDLGKATFIDEISLNNNNQIVIQYNTYTQGQQDSITLPLQLKVIRNINIENDKKLDGTKQFYYQYDVDEQVDNENIKHYLSDSINEIVDIKLYGDNIVVLYSDPTIRHNIPNNKLIKMPYDGITGWDGSVPDETDTSTSPATKLFYWQNLGPILNGEHIFGHYTSPAALQAAYPNGFTGNYAGWVATVTENNKTSLYAYDYNGSRGWYEISSVAMNQVEPKSVMIIDENGTTPAQDSFLQINGYWFVEEDIQIATEIS